MSLLVGILAFIVLTIVITTILDILYNKNQVGAYQLAITALNLAIATVACLFIFFFFGFKHIGILILSYLGVVI